MNSISVLSLVLLAGLAAAQNCAEKWEKTYDCVEKIKFSPDAQTLARKREAILKKCVPNMPPQCAAVKKAGDQCTEQISKDSTLATVRSQIKENVAKCFERYPPSGPPSAGGFRPPPFVLGAGQGPPPPGGQFAPGPDPCGPNSEDQALCVKSETRNEKEAQEIAERLDKTQQECFKEVNDDKCRMEGNAQLGDCCEKAKQPYVHQAMNKMQECMQSAMNTTTTF